MYRIEITVFVMEILHPFLHFLLHYVIQSIFQFLDNLNVIFLQEMLYFPNFILIYILLHTYIYNLNNLITVSCIILASILSSSLGFSNSSISFVIVSFNSLNRFCIFICNFGINSSADGGGGAGL